MYKKVLSTFLRLRRRELERVCERSFLVNKMLIKLSNERRQVE